MLNVPAPFLLSSQKHLAFPGRQSNLSILPLAASGQNPGSQPCSVPSIPPVLSVGSASQRYSRFKGVLAAISTAIQALSSACPSLSRMRALPGLLLAHALPPSLSAPPHKPEWLPHIYWRVPCLPGLPTTSVRIRPWSCTTAHLPPPAQRLSLALLPQPAHLAPRSGLPLPIVLLSACIFSQCWCFWLELQASDSGPPPWRGLFS